MTRGLLTAAVVRVGDFLLEPAEEVPAEPELERAPPSPPLLAPRSVIAVFGLARRCGCTLVARALAAELAARDPNRAAAVASERGAGGPPLASPSASRLTAVLGDVPGAAITATGRLCLVAGADQRALADVARAHAPLVIDAGTGELGGLAARVADRVLLVSAPGVVPSLAAAGAQCLERLAMDAVVVLNRGAPAPTFGGATAALPHSRVGAQLALGGHRARGDLGLAVGALADLCGTAP